MSKKINERRVKEFIDLLKKLVAINYKYSDAYEDNDGSERADRRLMSITDKQDGILSKIWNLNKKLTREEKRIILKKLLKGLGNKLVGLKNISIPTWLYNYYDYEEE